MKNTNNTDANMSPEAARIMKNLSNKASGAHNTKYVRDAIQAAFEAGQKSAQKTVRKPTVGKKFSFTIAGSAIEQMMHEEGF